MNENGLFDLKGKTALVTGCNRGIGKALAIGLAEAGADIVGVSASIEPGSDVEIEVLKRNRKFKSFKCDFANRLDLYDFIKKVNEAFAIDILVNNAGTIMRKPAIEHPDEYWDKVIDINLNAQFIMSREFAKGMIKRGHGKIIFIASLLTFQGGITVPGYAASKGAIGQLIMALSNEWASKGLNVNGIAPGYITTDNTQALRNDPKRNQSILDRIPQGRWGQPEDLIGVATLLASKASNYINGTIITVDGGWMGR